MTDREFSGRLRAWRRQLKMTQKDLAGRSKTTRQQVIAYERGHSMPNMAAAERLAAALGLAGLSEFYGQTPAELSASVHAQAALRAKVAP